MGNDRLKQKIDGLIIRLGLVSVGQHVWCVPVGHKTPKKCQVRSYDFGECMDAETGETHAFGSARIYNPRNKWSETIDVDKLYPSKAACEAALTAPEGQKGRFEG